MDNNYEVKFPANMFVARLLNMIKRQYIRNNAAIFMIISKDNCHFKKILTTRKE